MHNTINHNVIKQVASEFAASVQDAYVGKYFSEYTPSQFAKGVEAVAHSIEAHVPLGQTYFNVGEALSGGAIGEDAAKKAAQAGFVFASEFAKFDSLHKVETRGYKIEGGVAEYKFAKHYSASEKSRIAQAFVGEDSAASIGLSATQFSDYDEYGLNEYGESFYLDGKHDAARISAVTIAGLNAVQGQPYKANAVLEAAAVVFGKLAEQAEAVNKAATKAAQSYIADLVSANKVEKGNAKAEVDGISKAKAAGYAEGAAFIVEHGQAFTQYKTDARGRQYAVGTFNHFDTGVLVLVFNAKPIAAEALEDAGISEDKAVKAIEAFLGGKASALNAFFIKEKAVTGSGKTIVKSTFDYTAFAAAIYFFSQH